MRSNQKNTDHTRRRELRQTLRPSLSIRTKIAVGVLVGLVAGAIALTSNLFGISGLIWPRITVDVSNPGDGKNASVASFAIRNSNSYPLENILVSIGICFLNFSGNLMRGDCTGRWASRLSPSQWKGRRLASDEAWTIDVREAFNTYGGSDNELVGGDIVIVVQFEQLLLPTIPRERLVRFMVKRGNDGRLYWAPVPME